MINVDVYVETVEPCYKPVVFSGQVLHLPYSRVASLTFTQVVKLLRCE